jgi:hypothetical protein
MVPGADLDKPEAKEPAIPTWMTEDELNVEEDVDAGGGGLNGARQLTIKDADGNSHKGIWKRQVDEFDYEEQNGRPLRDGVEAGTYHEREAAAYKLDSMLGGDLVVPPTVSRRHQETQGSLQAFVPGAKPSSRIHFSSELLEELKDDDAVRRQFLLDVVMANDDRHGGNTLWRKVGGALKPVSIDNGLAFPDQPMRFIFAVNDGHLQKALLTLDEGSLELLAKLDLEKVATLLKGYPSITENQIAETLGRIRSLTNDSKQFAVALEEAEWAHPTSVVETWVRTPLKDRAMLNQLTEEDLAEINRLAKRE